jgi:hypothetical protein
MATLAANMSTVTMEKNAEKKTWVYGMGSNEPFNWAREIQRSANEPNRYIETKFWKNARQNLPPNEFREPRRKRNQENARGAFATREPERIFRTKEDEEYDERIRRRIEESNFQGQRAAFEIYYKTRGRVRYKHFIEPIKLELRKLADSVANKMRNTIVEGNNVKFSQNAFSAIDAELKKIKKQHHMQVLRELPRGIAATHAGMISGERIQIPRGSDSLFSAVAQALSVRHQGIFIADPKRLGQASRRLREYARKVQCNTKQIHFEGALNRNHCRVIGKAESSTKTSNGKIILQPGTYGGETEILALALHAKTTIAVFSATPKLGIYTRVVPHRLYGINNTKEPPIFLLRRLGSSKDPEATAHYDLLYKVKPLRQLPSVQMIKSAREMMNTANTLTGNRQNAAAPPPAPPPPPPQPIQVVVQTPEPNGGGTKSKGGLGGLLDVGSFVGGDMAVVGTLALSCIAAAVQAVRR